MMKIGMSVQAKVVVSNKGEFEKRLDKVRQYVKGLIVRCEDVKYVFLKARQNA